MPKYRIDYEINNDENLEDDFENEYERNRLTKKLRNEGLETKGKGGNKDRNKRNKKETHRIVLDDGRKDHSN